jgi:hypothetical protein
MENPPYFLAKTTAGVISPLYSSGNTLICSSTVATLDDVAITDQQTNQTLMYDSDTSKWVNRKITISTDTTDFVITSPANGDRLYYQVSPPSWINVQPMFYSTNIYGKLKNSVVNANTKFSLLNSDNYDTFNEGNTSSFGITRTGSALSGFRESSTWKVDLSITLSIASINASSIFYYTFGTTLGGDLLFSQMYNTVNNPSKILCLNGILNSISNTATYTASLQLLSGSGYAGNTLGDIAVSFSMVEI